MKVCIKGAAEDVKFDDIQDVCLDFDRILLATDGSEPAILATQYAVTLAKTFNASIMAIYVDDGVEALQLPEEIEGDDSWEGYHPSVKGLGSPRSWPSATAFRSRSQSSAAASPSGSSRPRDDTAPT